MTRAVLLTVILASLIILGSSTSVFAAQLEARINPDTDSSPFKMSYLKTVFFEYPIGSKLSSDLNGKEWHLSGTADSSNPGVQDLINKLNQKLTSDRSSAKIGDLDVSYDIHFRGRDVGASVDYKVILEGHLTHYVIKKDQTRTLIDMGWRGMTVQGPITINGTDINQPLTSIASQMPDVGQMMSGSEAEQLLLQPIIDAEFIKSQPMTNWHFLFDPTGINVDASTFGLSKGISGFVVSNWTMGESSLREGRQVERVHEATFSADTTYNVKTVQAADNANIKSIGFGALDSLDGVEIAGVTPKAPQNYGTTSTGNFPIGIIYGMAALAAIGGGAFFVFSNRQMKKEQNQGQTGIDPSRLVSYSTSEASGGYKTNRGEAYLADDTGYQQTRSVYDEPTPQQYSAPPTVSSVEEPACGCAASKDMGSECDCEMQGSCLCDANCQCHADVCKEHVSSMR